MKHDYLNSLGALLIRAGRYQDGIERLKERMKASGGEGGIHDWILLALGHHDLGNTGTHACGFISFHCIAHSHLSLHAAHVQCNAMKWRTRAVMI